MEELDLKELFMLFWNRKVTIILMIAIFIVAGIIYTMEFVTPVYTSSTTLLLAKSDSSTDKTDTITTTDITLNSKLVSTYSTLVQSKSVLRQVISNLGMNLNEEELKNNIEVSQEKNTEIIRISVTNENAATAEKVANETARVFIQKVADIYKINNVQIVDQAEISTIPSNVNHTKDVIMFACVGFILAVIYVIIANMLDTTIKSAEEIEKNFKVPVLASIPLYNFEPIKTKGGKKK